MKHSLTLAAALLLASTQALAADGYAGLGLGLSKSALGTDDLAALNDGSFTRIEAENTDMGFSVFGGINLTPNLGIEAAYADLGEFTGEAVSDGSGFLYPAGTLELTLAPTALSLALKARAELNDSVGLYGKLGIARWDADVTASFSSLSSATESESGTDPLIGIGLSFTLGDNASLNLEATRYMDLLDYDTDVFGAALAFRFR